MTAILAFVVRWVVSGLIKKAVIALVAVGLIAGAYAKGRHDEGVKCNAEHAQIVTQYKKEAADVAAKAAADRAAADKKFTQGKFTVPTPRPRPRLGLLPKRVHNGSDGFARD